MDLHAAPLVLGAFLALSAAIAPAQDFAPAYPLASVLNTSDQVIADIDGDGVDDLFLAGESNWGPNNQTLKWFKGLGGGAFGPANDLPGFNDYGKVAVADFDGDGWNDVALAGKWGGLAWIRNTGGGIFATKTPLAGSDKYHSDVIAPDVDGDGDADIVYSSYYPGRTLGWFENLGSGVFSHKVIETGANSQYLAHADMDGDGHVDLVTVASGPQGGYEGMKVRLGNGSGGFTTAYAEVMFAVEWAEPVDIDQDGLLDVAWGHLNDQWGTGNQPSLMWARNLGGGTFGPGQLISLINYWCSANSRAFAFGDLDLDGHVDAIHGKASGGAFRWIPGLGNGVFGAPIDIPVPSCPSIGNTFLLNDIDNDSDLDLLAIIGYGTHVIENLMASQLTPSGGAWYEGATVTMSGGNYDPALPVEVVFESSSTPPGGDPPLPATVIDPQNITFTIPPGHLSGAGPQDVTARQGTYATTAVGGWTSWPSIEPVVTGDAATGGTLEVHAASAYGGVVYVFMAAQLGAAPVPLPDFHWAIALDLTTATQIGIGGLLSSPSWTGSFAPGLLQPGFSAWLQGVAWEFPPTGPVLSFTEATPFVVP